MHQMPVWYRVLICPLVHCSQCGLQRCTCRCYYCNVCMQWDHGPCCL